jgi:hypothetical protein
MTTKQIKIVREGVWPWGPHTDSVEAEIWSYGDFAFGTHWDCDGRIVICTELKTGAKVCEFSNVKRARAPYRMLPEQSAITCTKRLVDNGQMAKGVKRMAKELKKLNLPYPMNTLTVGENVKLQLQNLPK